MGTFELELVAGGVDADIQLNLAPVALGTDIVAATDDQAIHRLL